MKISDLYKKKITGTSGCATISDFKPIHANLGFHLPAGKYEFISDGKPMFRVVFLKDCNLMEVKKCL